MINNISESQLAYLEEKGKFTIACDNIFSPEEKVLLEKYGHLFEALSNGTILPIDTEQEQFVEVAQMRRAPQTDHEWAWFKYVERKKIEAKNGDALHKRPILQDDSFYSRDMAKNDKNSVYNIRKKKDEE